MEARDLYGLPLERFVAERATLAKSLRRRGERDEAGRVAKLPKPSVAAWTVNQLVRTQRRAVAALFKAGDALQRTQQDVLDGKGGGPALREAGERERAAVGTLLDAARGLLDSEGHGVSAATLDRVSDTLHAAALEPDARNEVQAGCLARELQHVGLGGGGLVAVPERTGGTAPRGTGRGKRKNKANSEREREAKRERAQRLKAARSEEMKARRATESAARELRSARERRDGAATALEEAQDALTAAELRAAEAARAHEQARDDLERL